MMSWRDLASPDIPVFELPAGVAEDLKRSIGGVRSPQFYTQMPAIASAMVVIKYKDGAVHTYEMPPGVSATIEPTLLNSRGEVWDGQIATHRQQSSHITFKFVPGREPLIITHRRTKGGR